MSLQKKIFICLTIVWMIVIYSHSAMQAEESTEESNSVGYAVSYVINPEFSEMAPPEKAEYVDSISIYIRKSGHMAEYAILTGLVMGWLYNKRKKLTLAFCFLFSVVYAGTDEFHQLFVKGRDGRVTDVLIDSIGAIVGMLLVLAVIKILEKVKACKKEKI